MTTKMLCAGLLATGILFGWSEHAVAADLFCPSANTIRQGLDTDSGGYAFSADTDAGTWKGSDPMATSGYARDVFFSAATVDRGRVYCDYRDPNDKTNAKEFRLVSPEGGTYAPAGTDTWKTETSAGKTVSRCMAVTVTPCPFRKAD